MLTLTQMIRLIGSVLVFSLISGCGLLAMEGGYAEPCDVHDEAGWKATQSNYLTKNFKNYRVTLSTEHLYRVQEPSLLIVVTGISYPLEPGSPSILLSPSTIVLEIHGKRIRPLDKIRESPSRRCGGVHSVPADLKACGSAVLSFDVHESIEDGFALYLGALEINGTLEAVPAVKFCYRPRSLKWQHIHG